MSGNNYTGTAYERRPSRIPTPYRRNKTINSARVVQNNQEPETAVVTEDSPDDDTTIEDLKLELYDMDIPDTREALRIHSLYSASIHKVDTSSNVANEQTCIVCNGKHRFDNCEVLKNTDFLKGHYIRYCQSLRREASSRASAFDGSAGTLPTTSDRGINKIGVKEDPASTSGNDDHLDFQTGRR